MNVLKPNKQATLEVLFTRGTPLREIARITGIDRKTVRSYHQRWLLATSNSPTLATGSKVPLTSPCEIPPPWPPALRPKPSLCEPYREFIEAQRRLKRNATAIYQDLVDLHGFGGAYNSVKRFVAKLDDAPAAQPFDRLAFMPGEEMQVDYGEGALTLVPGEQRYRRPRLFVATMRYSRASFRQVVWKSSQEVWAQLHETAFRHFGGCPQYVVLDNLKEGVLKPDLYEPDLNPVYAAMLKHYGVVADPARVRDPNRKGTVESAIGHTQGTALKGRRFESLQAQNEYLQHWEQNWARKRIHGTERRQVQAMLEEERPYLKPLPLLCMQYFRQQEYTVCDDGCVRVGHSSYAARPARIGTQVWVRVFERHIEILDRQGQRLRSHPKAQRPGSVVLPQEERVFNPSRQTQRILNEASRIGEHTSRLCELLFATEGRVGQRKLWGIVRLVNRYPRSIVEASCTQALEQGVYSYKWIKAQCEQALKEALLKLDQATNAGVAQAGLMTQQHVLIREADEYADLFGRAARAAGGVEMTLGGVA